MENDTFFFSIVIPVFQCSEKLVVTLNSVVDEPAEIIVVNGGLDEETAKVLQDFDSRIRSISEPDNGVYDAMNKGIRLASGRYLLFLGAGDKLRASVLKRITESMPPDGASMVYGNAFMHDKGLVWDGPWTPEKFRKRNICHQAIFYGRSIFDQTGGFDIRFKVLADYALNIRCFGIPAIQKIFIDEIISDYEGHGMSHRIKDEVFNQERPALLREHLGIQ